MPENHAYKTPNRCTHIKVTGHQCGSPALRGEFFCYFHTRMIKGVAMRRDFRLKPPAMLLENEEAVQVAIMEVIDGILSGMIELKRASLVIKALHIAQRNVRGVRFGVRAEDMVREVPNYDAQFLQEYEAQEERARKAREESAAKEAEEKAAQEAAQAAAVAEPELEPVAAEVSPVAKKPAARAKKSGLSDSPVSDREERAWREVKRVESAIEGGMRGNLSDMKTAFAAAGIGPRRRKH